MSIRPAQMVTLLAACLVASGALAGPLDPPPGPIAPTAKPLAEVEPRIAINQANTPSGGTSMFVISQPGSYYLPADTFIPEPFTMGIVLTSGDVTIDLGGFRLDGGARAVRGIWSGVADRVVVRNGRISSCNATGIDLLFRSGCVVEDVAVEACTPVGIALGNRARVTRCSSDRNAGSGIVVGDNSVVEVCAARLNTVGVASAGIQVGSSSRVVDCVANQNAGTGIVLGGNSSVVGCVANANGTGINAATGASIERCTANINSGPGIVVGLNSSVLDCVASVNSGFGIVAGAGSAVVERCNADENTSTGISVGGNSSVRACVARGNATGIAAADGSTVERCTASENAQRGIVMNNGGTVRACTTRNNQSDGIYLNFSCIAVDNNCNGDGAAAGVHGAIRAVGQANRIEGNNITFADRGLLVESGGNVIVRNSLKGCTVNFDIVGGNDVGPIGSAAAATSPWANIQF